MKVYIVSGNQLCGIGIPGELCIAGAGLARGYLNKPELTAEKFVPNPFGEGRMYRSGDLARWLPDGNIQYLGRMDDQVKIRGYRVELSEIEYCLKQNPEVRDAAVTIRCFGNEPSICAYFTSDSEPDSRQLRNYLKDTLPDYMIPAFIVRIPEIPVNQSGKTDVKALNKIEISVPKTYSAPENRLQEILAVVFTDVLGAENISIDDDFYEMGGDSIKCIRIVSKLREFNIQLSIQDIIKYGTIRRISENAGIGRIITYSQDAYSGSVEPLYVQKLFLEKWQFPKPAHFDQAMIFLLRNPDREALLAALDAVVTQHDMLRAVLRNGKLEIPELNQSKLYDLYETKLTANEEAEKYAEAEAFCNTVHESFDLTNGPLVKVILFRDKSDLHLWIAAHHLVMDGVSWDIFLQDLTSGYQQYIRKKHIRLPDKTASFCLWADALRQYGMREAFADETAYWETVQAQAEACRIETYGTPEGICRNLYFETNETVFEALLSGTANSYEMQVYLLAALHLAAQRCFDMQQTAVQLESHGREEILPDVNTSRTIGWFTSTYPVIFETAEDEAGCINAVREALAQVPNHGIGYGIAANGGMLPSASPLDIAFNFLENPENEENPLLSHSALPIGQEVSELNHFGNAFMWNLEVMSDTLNITLNYDEALTDSETAEAFFTEYQNALEDIINSALYTVQQVISITDEDKEAIEGMLDGLEL